jgi:L-lactate dehydrogenase complex protein LldG
VFTLFESFESRARAVSAEVHRFPAKAEALSFILDFVRSAEGGLIQPSFAVWADCPFLRGLDLLGLTEQAPGLAFQVTRGSASTATLGISQMDLAIADTGTLVQDATAVEQRLVSTLPSVHIAIVATEAIVPDMPAALMRFCTGPLNQQGVACPPPYLSFITGPSRTADIERVLTIGVHGPERLVIVCVDDLEGRP